MTQTRPNDESGGNPEPRSAAIVPQQPTRTMQDLADFIDMAREVTSRTRAAYDADVTLRLAGKR